MSQLASPDAHPTQPSREVPRSIRPPAVEFEHPASPSRHERFTQLAHELEGLADVSAEVHITEDGEYRLLLDWLRKQRDIDTLAQLVQDRELHRTADDRTWRRAIFGDTIGLDEQGQELPYAAVKQQFKALEKLLERNYRVLSVRAQQLQGEPYSLTPEEMQYMAIIMQESPFVRLLASSSLFRDLMNREELVFKKEGHWPEEIKQADSSFVHILCQLWLLNTDEQPEIVAWPTDEQGNEIDRAYWEEHRRSIARWQALTHDLGKVIHASHPDHGLLSGQIARELLTAAGAEDRLVEAVVFMNEIHHLFSFMADEMNPDVKRAKRDFEGTLAEMYQQLIAGETAHPGEPIDQFKTRVLKKLFDPNAVADSWGGDQRNQGGLTSLRWFLDTVTSHPWMAIEMARFTMADVATSEKHYRFLIENIWLFKALKEYVGIVEQEDRVPQHEMPKDRSRVKLRPEDVRDEMNLEKDDPNGFSISLRDALQGYRKAHTDSDHEVASSGAE